jgi:hypothetical protein
MAVRPVQDRFKGLTHKKNPPQARGGFFIGYSEKGYLMPYFRKIFFRGFMIDFAQRV